MRKISITLYKDGKHWGVRDWWTSIPAAGSFIKLMNHRTNSLDLYHVNRVIYVDPEETECARAGTQLIHIDIEPWEF